MQDQRNWRAQRTSTATRWRRGLCALSIAALAAGCSTSTESGATTEMSTASASQPQTIASSTPPASEFGGSNAVQNVNADEYYLGYGKHAFRLESGTAGCWFNPNNHDDPQPHLSCNVRDLVSDPSVRNQFTGRDETANDVVLDAAGVRRGIDMAGGQLAGPTLHPGATLSVGPLACTATSVTSLSCSGPTGSFDFDGDAASVTIAGEDTSAASNAAVLAGPGQVCGEVGTRSGPRPVAVLTGQVGCETALRIADTYVNDVSVVKQGQGQFAQVDGWLCMWAYVEGRSHRDSYLRCDDDPVAAQASFRIGN